MLLSEDGTGLIGREVLHGCLFFFVGDGERFGNEDGQA
jgi:hypothetical protein